MCRHFLKKVDNLEVELRWLELTSRTKPDTLHEIKNKVSDALNTLCCDPTCETCDESLDPS